MSGCGELSATGGVAGAESSCCVFHGSTSGLGSSSEEDAAGDAPSRGRAAQPAGDGGGGSGVAGGAAAPATEVCSARREHTPRSSSLIAVHSGLSVAAAPAGALRTDLRASILPSDSSSELTRRVDAALGLRRMCGLCGAPASASHLAAATSAGSWAGGKYATTGDWRPRTGDGVAKMAATLSGLGATGERQPTPAASRGAAPLAPAAQRFGLT